MVVNVLWCLARLAAGEPSITPAIVERLWDERRGLFLDVARGDLAHEDRTDAAGGDRRVRTSTWSALAPLALPDLPEEIGRRLVEEHLLDRRRYWLPFPPTSVSAAGAELRAPQVEGRCCGASTGAGRPGSTRPGCSGSACCGSATTPRRRRWRSALSDAVAEERLREFYEPYSGEGLGAKEFGWSSLIAELADPDPAAARSYLG